MLITVFLLKSYGLCLIGFFCPFMGVFIVKKGIVLIKLTKIHFFVNFFKYEFQYYTF